MAAPEASCSSRNQTVEGPLLSGSAGRVTGRVAIHESHELASDASNMPPAAFLKSVSIRLGFASNAIKNNSPRSKNASSTSVMHSSWIQRLKPSGQSCTSKDEPPAFSKRENIVCTHFTKDYSSCSRRLDTLPHHTRSSSWPPHEDLSKVVRKLPMEVGDPVYCIAREHENTAASYPNLNHHIIISVTSKNATQSSEAGSRTGSQQDFQKCVPTLEGFVPCAQLNALNKHTSSLGRSKDLQDSEDKDHRTPHNYSGEQFKDLIKDKNKADFIAVSEQAKGQSQEVQNNCSYSGGSFPAYRDLVNAPRLPVSVCGVGHSSGASADADASIRCAKALNFGVVDDEEIHQTSFGESECKANYRAAVVLRNKGKFDQFGLILPSHRGAVQDGKDARDLRLLQQAKQNFHMFKGAATKVYLQNGFGNVSPNESHLSHSNYQRAGACTRDAMNAYGNAPHTIGNFAFKSQNIVSKSSRMDAPCSRRVTSQNPHYGEEGQASRSPVSIKSIHEDAARARIREKSLGDYWNSWVRVLKEPDDCRLLNRGHSEESLRQDFSMERFGQKPSSVKENFLNFNSCKSRNLVNSVKDTDSGHCGQQSFPFMEHDKYSSNRIKSKQLNVSSAHLSNFRVDCLDVSQDPYEGATESPFTNGRVIVEAKFLEDGLAPLVFANLHVCVLVTSWLSREINLWVPLLLMFFMGLC